MKKFSLKAEQKTAPHWYKIQGWLPNRYLPLVMFDSICIYKPKMKGGHTHNHQRNALERKLNRSKESRKRCHNVLNKGYEYKFVLNRCNLVRVKYKIIGLDRAKEGERDKCYASFVRFMKKGIVLEGSVPIIDELESLSPWSKHDSKAILKRASKDIQDKIGSILFTSTKKGDLK